VLIREPSHRRPHDTALLSSASAGGDWFQKHVVPERTVTREDSGKEIGWTNILIVMKACDAQMAGESFTWISEKWRRF